MSRLRPFLLVTVMAIAAVSCELRGANSTEARANAGQALRNVLAYPQSSLVSLSSGNEAAELVLTSPAPIDTIVAWYREFLPLNKWTMKTNSKNRAGTVTIYAERDARPLWITLEPNVGGGTTYRLVGVFNIDSTKADSTRK